MTRLHHLIQYFIDHLPGCGRTQIAKYLYLADYEARRYLGRPITGLQYRLDHHGPFDVKILHTLDELRFLNHVHEETVQFPSGKQGYRYTNAEPPDEIGSHFDEAERAILNAVVVRYGKTPLQQLLDEVVYETEPMQDARDRDGFRQPLRMELVDNQERIPGLELEEMLQADHDLRSGKGIPLKDVTAKRDG